MQANKKPYHEASPSVKEPQRTPREHHHSQWSWRVRKYACTLMSLRHCKYLFFF